MDVFFDVKISLLHISNTDKLFISIILGICKTMTSAELQSWLMINMSSIRPSQCWKNIYIYFLGNICTSEAEEDSNIAEVPEETSGRRTK